LRISGAEGQQSRRENGQYGREPEDLHSHGESDMRHKLDWFRD
jgi:hypothetical protein